MKQLRYFLALTLVATLVLAPGAAAQQMNDDQLMDDGRMDNNMMASPSASASATPSATAMASTSATATASATSSAASMVAESDGSSASAAVGGQLPTTGGVPLVPWVSMGILALLIGSGLVAARLGSRSI
jgi:hypothetical protein